MAQTETNRPKGQKNKKLMLIRYGKMGLIGWFQHSESKIPKSHSRAVIKTARGMELGDIVGQFSYRGGHFKSSPSQVEEYFDKENKEYPLTDGGTFVRFATTADIMEDKHLQASAKEESKCCERFIKEMDLPMKVVDAEHLFGGERIIIYFSSEGRVDFRELVKRLAREYQTRIELRQIGARDEARIISDFESCGQECCCRRFLKILEPVNMRMAKLQKATLDPSKISGHCGRLKCCLRYEDQTYRELKGRLPRKNARVRAGGMEGKVVNVQILTQLVVVQNEAGKREAYPVDDVEIIDERGKPAAGKAQKQENKQDKHAQAAEEKTSEQADSGEKQNGGDNAAVKSEPGDSPDRNDNNRNENKKRNRNRNRNNRGNSGQRRPT
jgi:cell fate regulator YaaT (PSP1 superfamily)